MATASFAAQTTATVKIAVLDSPRGDKHSGRVTSIIRTECPNCSIQLFSIYDQDLRLDKNKMLKQLQGIHASTKILNLSWNMEYDPSFDSIIRELNRISDEGVILVGAAGQPEEVSPAVDPLIENTVISRVRNIILVAELDSKSKIPLGSYTGRKISIAIKNLDQGKGSSFSAAKVSGYIGSYVSKSKQSARKFITTESLLKQIEIKREMSAHLWPELKEIL